MTLAILEFLGILIAHFLLESMSVILNILTCHRQRFMNALWLGYVTRPHISWCQQKVLIALHICRKFKNSFCLNKGLKHAKTKQTIFHFIF